MERLGLKGRSSGVSCEDVKYIVMSPMILCRC